MKVIIAGGRHLPHTKENAALLIELIERSGFAITAVISGACGLDFDALDRRDGKAKGADGLGEMLAKVNEVPVLRYYAAFRRLGPCAGPMRNRRMLKEAEGLITLPGGRGTADIRREAHRRGIPMYPPWEV